MTSASSTTTGGATRAELDYAREKSASVIDDVRERDAAAIDDRALVAYERKWMRRLTRLQRSRPARWHVRGLSDEEVRAALSLRLLELVRGPREAWTAYCRAGREWGLCVLQHELAMLRKAFRLETLAVDFGDTPFCVRSPDPEEHWLEVEADTRRALAREGAERALSRPQRRWLAALRAAAERGEFFSASDALNLSAVSREIGKNRSSALRAYRELQVRFQSELERVPAPGARRRTGA